MRHKSVPQADEELTLGLNLAVNRAVVLVGVLAAIAFISSVIVLTTQATIAEKERFARMAADASNQIESPLHY